MKENEILSREEKAKITLNLVGFVLMVACVVVAILIATGVIIYRFVLPLIAILFVMDCVSVCFLDYSIKQIDKRRFLMQLIVYAIVVLIALAYLVLVL